MTEPQYKLSLAQMHWDISKLLELTQRITQGEPHCVRPSKRFGKGASLPEKALF